MNKTDAVIEQKAPAVLTDQHTRVSIVCTAKNERGAMVDVGILEIVQDNMTNELKVSYGVTPAQAIAMLERTLKNLRIHSENELNDQLHSRLH
ncbi:hypothetical protein K9692_004291 [Escherichia coli]|uniref:hypothetical protein n=1 Tax=Buttiauxella gaviniae TaxID=82990 RepID=UPI001DA71232|nr:hypothetical protein [Escherichia coli]